MRISLNWLKKYVSVPVSDEELVRLIGARLVEVEGVIDESEKYNNIYVVRVAIAEKIPDTHLTLCQIDNGGEDLIQVGVIGLLKAYQKTIPLQAMNTCSIYKSFERGVLRQKT